MTPKEKAEELFQKFIRFTSADEELEFEYTKQCALIAVDELIESHLLLTTTHEYKPSVRCKSYWKQVKKEIEKL